MGTLRFENFQVASSQQQLEVPKKVLYGIRTCQKVVGLEMEAGKLFASFSARTSDIHKRTELMKQGVHEMGGFVNSWRDMVAVFEKLSTLGETLSSCFASAAGPLETTFRELSLEKEEFLSQKAERARSPPPPRSAPPNDDSKRQRLEDRLLLANQEHESAVKARQMITERLGHTIKDSMKEKIDERVERATRLKRKAEQEIASYDKLQHRSGGTNGSNVAPYIVSNGCYGKVDSWEDKRLDALKKSLIIAAQSLDAFQKEVTIVVSQFCESVDNFDPFDDKQNYLSRILGVPKPPKTKSSSKYPTCLSSIPIRLSSPVVGDSEECSTLRNALKAAEDLNRNLVAKHHGELRAMEDMLNHQVLTTQELRAEGAATGRHHRVTTPRTSDAADLTIPLKSRRSLVWQQNSAKESHHDEMGGFMEGLAPGGIATNHQVDSQSLLTEPLEATGSTPFSLTINEVDDHRGGGSTGGADWPYKSAVQDATTTADSDFDRKLPDFLSHVLAPVEEYSGASEAEFFIERQRRYEEFILALRSFVNPRRSDATWEDPMFFGGAEIIEGFDQYPFKLPSEATKLPATTPYVALEWGSPNMNQRQWSLLAYETLLLVYLYACDEKIEDEMVELPGRDIHTVSAEQYAAVQVESSVAQKERTRYRRGPVRTTNRRERRISVNPIVLHHKLSEGNVLLLRNLVTLLRVKLGLAGQYNQMISQLTLTNCDFERSGEWTNLHPLDVRFRLARLLDCWNRAEAGSFQNLSAIVLQEWIYRQLHILETCISFKLWRLVKFIPSITKPVLDSLNGWTEFGTYRPELRRLISKFPKDMDDNHGGRLNLILRLLLQSLDIIGEFNQALEEGEWGVPIDGTNRNISGIHRLLMVMNSISAIDKKIRYKIAMDEKCLPLARIKDATPKYGQPYISSEEEDVESEENGDFAVVPSVDNSEEFSLLTTKILTPLDPYWAYDVPIVHYLFSTLWNAVTDTASFDSLHVEAPILACGIMAAAHIVQIGMDPSMSESPLGFSVATLSIQSHSLLAVSALWSAAYNSVNNTSDDGDDDGHHHPHVQAIIPTESLRIIRRLLDPSEFCDWIMMESDSLGDDSNPSAIAIQSNSRTSAPQSDLPMEPNGSSEVTQARASRILNTMTYYPWETLFHTRGESRGVSDKSYAKLDWSDPDFFVIDTTCLPENNSSFPPSSCFQSLEGIRDEPEGVSLVCASRVERVMEEVIGNRLITAQFRSELVMVLCNYRFQLEPDAIPIVIEIWDQLRKCLYPDVKEQQPKLPQISQFNIQQPITELLAGPSFQYDLYRYFIHQTVVNLSGRLFQKPRDIIEKRASLGEGEDIVKLYGESIKAFVEEVRGELIFYPKFWSKLLPSHQHALIVINASKSCLLEVVNELSSKTALFPDDNIPPFGYLVLDGVTSFEKLLKEVGAITRLDLATEPSLLEPFSRSVTGALTARFASLEEALKRCMVSDTYEGSVEGGYHSVAVVDLFSFINHMFLAIKELHAPIQWAAPCFLQFVSRLSSSYSDHIVSDCNNHNLSQVQDSSNLIFDNLLHPLARVEGMEGLEALFDLDRKRRSQPSVGGFIKSVGKITGFKGKSTKRKPLPDRGGGGGGALPPSTPSQNNNSPRNDHVQSQISFERKTEKLLSSELSAPESETRSEISGKPSKKQKKKTKKNESKSALPEAFSEVSTRLGKHIAFNYFMIKQSLSKVSSLRSWLLRLHNLFYFNSQIPSIGSEFRDLCRSALMERDPKCNELYRALHILDQGGNYSLDEAPLSSDENPIRNFDDMGEFEKLNQLINGSLQTCTKIVEERAIQLCRFISLKLIYFDYGDDLFEEMYNTPFNRCTLIDILTAFRDTVERFISSAPETYGDYLRQFIIEDLTKCWLLVVTEMGYHGYVFRREDLDVLEDDLDALKDYISKAAGVSGELKVRGATSKQEGVVNIAGYVNDFICLIASEPQCLAQLGGNLGRHHQQPAAGMDFGDAKVEILQGDIGEARLLFGDFTTETKLEKKTKSTKKKWQKFLGGL